MNDYQSGRQKGFNGLNDYQSGDNSIGFVSYSTDVTINLPIGKYDLNQQSMFVGAINSLEASGNTATFDGIVVAMKMLQDEMAANPDVKPLIFVLVTERRTLATLSTIFGN